MSLRRKNLTPRKKRWLAGGWRREERTNACNHPCRCDSCFRGYWDTLAREGRQHLIRSNGTPEAALQNLGDELKSASWTQAYDSLANKTSFTDTDFLHDLVGAYPNLRTYSKLERFEFHPLHQTDSDAEFLVKLHW